MSLRATVSRADRRLAASFVFEGEGEPVVECAGTLRELAPGVAAALLVGGVAAACALAFRRCPDGLQVRATSSIPAGSIELAVAVSVAAAAAANAVLGLGLDDASVARASGDAVDQALGDRDGVVVASDVVSEYRIAVRESCPE